MRTRHFLLKSIIRQSTNLQVQNLSFFNFPRFNIIITQFSRTQILLFQLIILRNRKRREIDENFKSIFQRISRYFHRLFLLSSHPQFTFSIHAFH